MRRRLAAFQERESNVQDCFHRRSRPPAALFGRLFATIDRLLMAYAEMTIRNGDTPRSNV